MNTWRRNLSMFKWSMGKMTQNFFWCHKLWFLDLVIVKVAADEQMPMEGIVFRIHFHKLLVLLHNKVSLCVTHQLHCGTSMRVCEDRENAASVPITRYLSPNSDIAVLWDTVKSAKADSISREFIMLDTETNSLSPRLYMSSHECGILGNRLLGLSLFIGL